MTALPYGPPHDPRAMERWTRVVEAVGAGVVGEGRAEMPCPAHGGEKPSALAISLGEQTDYPAVFCRTEHCDYGDIRAALVALGAPADALQPAKGGGAGQRPSGAGPARRVAVPAAGPVLPTEQQVEAWHEALMRDRMMRRVIKSKWRTTDEALALADVGWDAQQGRYTFPVRDVAGDVVQVIYRDFRDDRPAGVPKSKTHKGVTGSHLYAPFGIAEGRRVVLCAGEKDAFAAHGVGLNAVSVTNGEHAAPSSERLAVLCDAEVVIVYDNDDAGRTGARTIAAAVAEVASKVWVADLAVVPEMPDKGDVADVLAMSDGEALLRSVLLAAVPWSGQTAADGERSSSWDVQDLSDVLTGDYEPQHPSIGTRSDGVCLFYRGLKHAIVAESEAGKTWLALLAMVEQMQVGEQVVFIDFEDSAHGIVGRLRALGVPTGLIASHFHYLRPDEPLTDELRAVVVAAVGLLSPALVVVDGVTEAMAVHGWEINSNNDVALFYKTVLTPFADLGAAVIALDHLPKDDVKRRGSIGGVHKLNGIDGAVYRMENVKPLIPKHEGLSRVIVDKDRPGQVHQHQDEKKRIADFLFFGAEDGSVAMNLEPPAAPRDDADAPANDKTLRENVRRVQAVLGVGEERTVRFMEQRLNELGQSMSLSTLQRHLRTLQDLGYAKSRAEQGKGRDVFYWTGLAVTTS